MYSRLLLSPALALVYLAGPTFGQLAPMRPIPADVAKSFRITKGTVQDLVLPLPNAKATPFEAKVVLGGKVMTLALRPYSIRAPGFKAYADDGNGLREVAPPAPRTFRGEVEALPGSIVAGSLVDGQLSAVIYHDSGDWAIEPLSKVRQSAPWFHHVVYAKRDLVAQDAKCPGGAHTAHAAPPDRRANVGPQAVQVCELACEADSSYFRISGSVLRAIINVENSVLAVEPIFKRDLEIQYQITAVVVRTAQIYRKFANAASFLSEIRARWNSTLRFIPRDVTHLWTVHRDTTNGANYGLAYQNGICASTTSGLGYGFHRRNFGSLVADTGAMAHILGHNWAATHCDRFSSCFIMCGASFGGCGRNLTKFGVEAQMQVKAFKASRRCLSGEQVDLHIAALGGYGTTMSAGANYTLDVWTQNRGHATSKPSRTLIVFSYDGVVSKTDPYLAVINVPALAHNQTSKNRIVITIPYCVRADPSAIIGILADVDGVNAESNESNNLGGSAPFRTIPYTGPNRVIEYSEPVFPQQRAHEGFIFLKTRRRFPLCVKAPQLPGGLYYLTWSRNRTPFAYDSATVLSTVLTNSAVLPFWFGFLDGDGYSHPGLALNWPGIPNGVPGDFWVHGWFYDRSFKYVGSATRGSSNPWSLLMGFLP